MKNNVGSFGVAQALVIGLSLGLVLSSAVSCTGKPPPARCNKNTCPDGCCSNDGVCYGKNDAGVQSNEACGTEGNECSVCTMSQVCVDGQCRLGGNAGGAGGGSGGAGGTGGTGGGMSGDGGTCNATTCAGGCCNAAGTCVLPAMQNFTRCGSGGASCAGCPNGQACSMKTDGGTGNACAVPSCTACLDTSGNCRTDKQTMTDNDYCGAGGAVCARCDTNAQQMCVNGRCVGMSAQCNAGNCDGCCSGNTCIAADGGISNAQCGRNATQCTTCTSPATCDTQTGMCTGGGTGDGGISPPLDGGFGVCDATTCPSGCCIFGAGCIADGMSFGLGVACGTGGSVCKLCLLAPDCATGMALMLCQ